MDEKSDSETSDTPRLTAPVFSPMCPPCITSISHEALVKWKSERAAYEAMLDSQMFLHTRRPANLTVSVKSTMDQSLLATCCEMKWGTTADRISDREFLMEFDKILGSVKNNRLPKIDKLFDEGLHMNLKETDVTARVIDYFRDCNELIEKNGLASVFSGDAGKSEKCSQLVRRLEPAALRETVVEHQRFQDQKSKSCATTLFKLVEEKALLQEQLFQYTKTETRKKRSFVKSEQKGKKKAKHAQAKTRQGQSGEPQEAKFSNDCDIADRYHKRVFLNCKGDHLVRSCPTASKDEKKRLLAQLRESAVGKKSRPTGESNAKRVSCSGADRVDPCASVRLNGALAVPYCADSGSDWNIISVKHVRALQLKDSSVKTRALGQPVVCRTVGGVITATTAVDLYLTIHTAAGPVRCQDRKECLVIENKDEELIVGKSLLAEIGIDVDRQLEMLAAQSVDLDDDPITMDEVPDPVTPAQDADVVKAIDFLVNEAIGNGFPAKSREKLLVVCHLYDIWRLALGDDPPAKVEPLKVRLKPNAIPYKCRARSYSPEKSKFLEDFNRELVALGWVYENSRSRWACPAMPVRKPHSNEFRQTSDYRPVNELTEAIVGIMPNLQVALEHCKHKKYYAVFDFLKGFWQLPLAKESQEIMSYMTDKKVFTPTRVPQGCTDAALHFQVTVEKVLADLLYKEVLVWIDDLLLFADTVEELVNIKQKVFKRLDEYGLKLNPKKSHLFLTKVKWCGRVISAEGVGHDPERIEALREIPYPSSAAELQQFVCATNWLREGLVDYARVVNPLQTRLQRELKGRKRTKAAAARVALELSDDEKVAFDQVKQLLLRSAVLTYPSPQYPMCLLSDASDTGWGLIVTQVPGWDSTVPIQSQSHELLICMGGTFKGSQLNWSVLEKEMFPIAHACEKLEYLLLRPQGFKIYCDHRNIVHLFAPGKELKKHTRGKLLRWSIKLLGFRYEIEHIAGRNNVWADLLSRWGGGKNDLFEASGPNGSTTCTSSIDDSKDHERVFCSNSRADQEQQVAKRRKNGSASLRHDTAASKRDRTVLVENDVVSEFGRTTPVGDHVVGERGRTVLREVNVAGMRDRTSPTGKHVAGECSRTGVTADTVDEHAVHVARARSAKYCWNGGVDVRGVAQVRSIDNAGYDSAADVSECDMVIPNQVQQVNSSWSGTGLGEAVRLNSNSEIMQGYPITRAKHVKTRAKTRGIMRAQIRPLQSEDFVWPSLSEIARAQKRHAVPAGAEKDADGVWLVNDRVWIPEDENELLVRLFVVAHCGSTRHRGIASMRMDIARHFEIQHLGEKIQRFCAECLLCLHVKGGKIVPRPWSESFHFTIRNEALHLDFLSLGPSFEGSNYVLVMKDAATHFTQLVRCESPTAEVAVNAIIDWYSSFGMPRVWISDCGSHFKNRVIAQLASKLKAKQEFTLAYCPWRNGTVERVNRDVLQVLRVMLLEYKINQRDWPYLLPLVQASINHTKVASLAHRAPVELFTGLESASPLRVIVGSSNEDRLAAISEIGPNVEAQLHKLRQGLCEMHLAVHAEKKKRVQYHKRKDRGRCVDFSVGDYVLRSRVDERKGSGKLIATWVGPFKVVDAHEYYFDVEHLITRERVSVHTSRLKFYRDDTLNVTKELLEHVAAQNLLLGVETIRSHRYNENMKRYELLVKWQEFEEIEDSWEPADAIAADIPVLVRRYAEQSKDADLSRQLGASGSEHPAEAESVPSQTRKAW